MDTIFKLRTLKSETQKIHFNILLADDDVDDRFFFAKALNELPFDANLSTVHDGDQLMDYLSRNTGYLPDVLFLDLSMPRKTGFECLTEIKENPKLNDMRVVIFSTSYSRDIYYEQGIIKMLYDIGAQDYIRKPGGLVQLKEVIQKVIFKVIENEKIKNSHPSHSTHE